MITGAVYRMAGTVGYQIHENLQVPLRDGVHLATDLYVPEGDQPRPAILIRTAYDKGSFRGRCSYFASHGYLVVAQDVRGTFRSGGEFFAFVHEAEDGVDVLDWLAERPECNGRVGMFGCSYMSWVQLAVATQGHPALACLIPFGVAIDTYHHYAYPDGGLQLGLLRWVIYDVWRRDAVLHGRQDEIEAIEQLNFLEFAAELPWRKGETILALNPTYEAIILRYLEERTYSPFWQGPGQGFFRYLDRFPDIPMLWVSGWYDGYPRSVIQGVQALCRSGRDQQYLLLGPWVHNQLQGQTAGEADFGERCPVERLGIPLAFFNRFLKGDSATDPGARVRAFIMGGGSGRRTAEGLLDHGGEWWSGESWPPPAAKEQRLFLTPAGTLARAASEGASRTWQHDPADPVPSIAAPWIFSHQPRGPHDLREPHPMLGNCQPGRPLAERSDVLVFQTDPLPEPLTLLGPFTVTLWVSSDCPDTDFMVKLVDVYPPSDDYPEGYAFPVCEGMQRMAYRQGSDQLQLMSPGETYEIEIECFPAANRFAAGHRLRLDLASSNFPRYEINRNTGDYASSARQVARNTVFLGSCTPSRVTFHVLP